MTRNYILYGAPISYFAGKARAYLRRKHIPYEEILITPDIWESVILPRVGYPIMPVVVTPEDETLQDTTEIIDFLEQRFPDQSVYPTGPKQRLAALLIEIYADEWLWNTALYYRWAYDEEWIYKEWGRMAAPGKPVEEQLAAARSQSEYFRGTLPALGVTAASAPAIEASYEALLADLNIHFERYPFLLGSRPSIGDYGLIAPFYGHLYRDPACGKIMRSLAPRVSEWVERMEFALEPLTGEFLSDDEIPETLIPVLSRAMTEQMPVLAATVEKIAAWAAKLGTTEEATFDESTPFSLAREAGGKQGDGDARPLVPRYLDWHDVMIGNVTVPRRIHPYSQWMLQRAIDYYAGLDGETRAAADALLERIGGDGFRSIQIETRVCRENFKLVLA